MKLLITTLIITLTYQAHAQILVFPSTKKVETKLDSEMMRFVAETLHAGKLAVHLACEVRVREFNQERKFSDGVRIVEMLQIRFLSGMMGRPENVIYFPVGSPLTKEVKVSQYSGPVEEIQLEAEDVANSRFIFQHNGRGEIVHMSFENDLMTLPCRLQYGH